MADMEDLVRQLMATRSMITCLLPGLEAPVDALTGRLLAAVGAAGPRRQQPVMVHGDFSADQVLVDGPAVRIIDFDRVTTSDPARDLGSFAAVEDIADPAGVGPVAGGRKTAQLIDGYREAGGRVIAGQGGDLGGLPVVPEQRRPVQEPGQRLAGRHELAYPPGPGVDRMSWHPPLWKYTDDAGTAWRVRNAWPDMEPGEYLLEVAAAGRPGVRGAHLSHGHFEILPEDDPGLPALRTERQRGEIIAHWPYMRAIIRAEGCYIKVFRPGRAAVPAERCAQMDLLLDAGDFTAPKVLQSSPDTLVLSALSGPDARRNRRGLRHDRREGVCRRMGKMVQRLARPAERGV